MRLARLLSLAPLLVGLATSSLVGAQPPGAPPVPHAAVVSPAPRPAPSVAHARPASAPVPVRALVRVATPTLDVSIPAPAARTQLLQVRDEVTRRVGAGEHPVVVFDIDDTLLTWPRPDLPTRQPIPGALGYLSSLKSAGAKIVYITGRHEESRAETVAHLQQHGFPVGPEVELVLNDSKLPTVEYKAVATRNVVKTLGKPIAVFDNEKENARMFRRELPDASTAIFRLRTTTQNPDSGGTGPITVIDDFTPALPTEIRLKS